MAEQTQLIPLVQRAYGQPVSVNFDEFNQNIQRGVDRKEKRQEYMASLLSMGADLDAKGWESWMKDFNAVTDKIDNKELKFGSTDFYKAVTNLERKANGINQANKLLEDLQTNIQRDPEKYQFMQPYQTESGEQFNYNAGLEGLKKNINSLRQGDYENADSYIEAIGSLGNNLRVSPYDRAQMEKMIGEDAAKLEEVLYSETQPKASQRYIGGGYNQATISYVPDEPVYNDKLNVLRDKYSGFYSDEYNNMVGTGRIDPSKVSREDFIQANVSRHLPKSKTDTKIIRAPQPTGRGTEKTEKPGIINPEEVNIAIAKSQLGNGDVSPLMEYVSSKGYNGKVDGADFVFYKVKYSGDKKTATDVTRIGISDTKALQDFVADVNKGVSRRELAETDYQPKSGITQETRIARQKDVDRKKAAFEKREEERKSQALESNVDKLVSMSDVDDSDKDKQKFIQSVNEIPGVTYITEWGDDQLEYTDKDGTVRRVEVQDSNRARIMAILKERGWNPGYEAKEFVVSESGSNTEESNNAEDTRATLPGRQ